jgi:hypothetical protein
MGSGRDGSASGPVRRALWHRLLNAEGPTALRRVNLAALVLAAGMSVSLHLYESRRPRFDLPAAQQQLRAVATREEAIAQGERLLRAVKSADDGLHRWRRFTAGAWMIAAFLFLLNLTLIRSDD